MDVGGYNNVNNVNNGVYVRKSVEKRFALKTRDVRVFRYSVIDLSFINHTDD